MKIALMGHNLHVGGGKTLSRELIANMARLAPQHEFIVTAPIGHGFGFLREYPNVELVEIPVYPLFRRAIWERGFAKTLNKAGCHWCWWLGNLGFAYPKCRQSVLVRSSFHVNYPLKNWNIQPSGWKTWLRCLLSRPFVKRTLRHCDSFFTQTETMRHRLMETYPFIKSYHSALCPSRVLFSDPAPPTPETAVKLEELAKKNEGKFKFVYVSIPYPHKNMDRIIEMAAKYREELRDVALYLTAGRDTRIGGGRTGEGLYRKIHTLGVENIVQLVGVVPHKDVPALYQAADASLFPTLLESFAQAPLESMHFRRPIVVSDMDFTHEVCGDAALYVDPFSMESIKEGILRVKNDPALREDLVAKGLERLKRRQPTWDEILLPIIHEFCDK